MAKPRPDGRGQGTAHPASDEVKSYLRTLLGRSEFGASERNRRFLSYVVKETLEGRADRIKAYNIALAAFDRTEDFDPLTDPIVRIEAGRLRRSLAHYYLTAGKSDRIRIEIPKGSYSATFGWADEEQAPPHGDPSGSAPKTEPAAPHIKAASPPTLKSGRASARGAGIAGALMLCAALFTAAFWPSEQPAGGHIPSIVVVPFDDISADASHAFVARGLTYELIAELTRFNELLVFGPETSFALVGKNPTVEPKSLNAD